MHNLTLSIPTYELDIQTFIMFNVVSIFFLVACLTITRHPRLLENTSCMWGKHDLIYSTLFVNVALKPSAEGSSEMINVVPSIEKS